MSIDGRIIIVTGGGQGIGATMARDLAAHGAFVVVADIDAESSAAVAREICDGNGTALACSTDVAEESSVAAMVESTLDEFGRVDGLINNAAIFSSIRMKPFYEIPLDEWEAMMRVNVTGTFLCTRAVVRPMKDAGRGRIVNFSSQAVTMGRPNYTHYTTSKAAIIGMTRSMGRELGEFGITVNAIMPGAIETEVPRDTVSPRQREAILAGQSIHRMGRPEDIAGLVRFLMSDDSAFITGQCHAVDGGFGYP